jgi:hypothetical protein
MEIKMATMAGTQEFMEAHKNHRLCMQVVESTQTTYDVDIQKLHNLHLYARLGEMDSRESMDNTQSYYLNCLDCEVEEEINLGEVIED